MAASRPPASSAVCNCRALASMMRRITSGSAREASDQLDELARRDGAHDAELQRRLLR